MCKINAKFRKNILRSRILFLLIISIVLIYTTLNASQFKAFFGRDDTGVQNLALKAEKVEASSFFKNRRKPGKGDKPPNAAADGDFGQQSHWRTGVDDKEKWIEITLKKKHDISALRIYTLYKPEQKIKSLTVYAGTSSPARTKIFSFKEPDISKYLNTSVFDNKVIKFKIQNISVIRLQFEADTVFIDEIELYESVPKDRSPYYDPNDTAIRMRKSISPQVLYNDKKMLVWFEHGYHKIFRDEVVKISKKTDPVCRVSLAKGEEEPFYIVFRSMKDVTDMKILIKDISGPGGKNAVTSEVYEVGYLFVRYPSFKLVTQMGNNNGLGRGFYPEYLLPKDHVRLVGNKHSPVWIRVKADKKAAAGEYTSTIRLLSRQAGIDINLKLKVKVFDFAVKNREYFKIMGSNHDITDNRDKITRSDMEYVKAFYHHAAKFGYTSPRHYWPKPEITEKNGRLIFDWTHFDEMTEYCVNELGFHDISLSGSGLASHLTSAEKKANKSWVEACYAPSYIVGRENLKPNSPAFWKSLEESLGIYYEHLKKKGWIDKFMFYLTDEPNRNVHQFLIRLAALVKKKMPGVRRMWLGGYLYPEIYNSAEIWCPNFKNFEWPAYHERVKTGQELWIYLNATWLIDNPPHGVRAYGIGFSKYNITGLLFYSLCKWRAGNPYEMARLNPFRNGDNQFIYPNPEGKNKLPFVNSLRLEMIRDGIEEMDYYNQFMTLRNKAAEMIVDLENRE